MGVAAPRAEEVGWGPRTLQKFSHGFQFAGQLLYT